MRPLPFGVVSVEFLREFEDVESSLLRFEAEVEASSSSGKSLLSFELLKHATFILHSACFSRCS